jgi:hypothetical protein
MVSGLRVKAAPAAHWIIIIYININKRRKKKRAKARTPAAEKLEPTERLQG